MDDPPRLQVGGGETNSEAPELQHEVAEFVRWFTSWWLTRGLELFAREDDERNAA